jgi:ethanolamine kinase
MAPSDYMKARSNAQETRVTVDGEAYLPFLTLDPSDEDSTKQVVGELLELPDWQQLQVKPVTGGITNKLFHVSGIMSKTDDNIPDSVLVRVFGGHGMIDRDIETSTYTALANQGIALGYYGRFENGRLEEWLGGMMTLTEPDMAIPEILLGIAKNLAQLHSKFVVPDPLKENHDPTKPPTLWTQLNSWLDKALASKFQNNHDTQRAQALDLSQLNDELAWLRSSVIPSDAKVGFCHNDLLAANMLWCQSSKTIQLIDFEYGGINYLSYDIANHFNEFAGGTSGNATPDYSQFPTLALQRTFVTEYLMTFNNGTTSSSQQVDCLLQEIKGFVLANHLVWGLWGINQAATEGCEEFDYLQYGTCRIQRYYFDKKVWGAQ